MTTTSALDPGAFELDLVIGELERLASKDAPEVAAELARKARFAAGTMWAGAWTAGHDAASAQFRAREVERAALEKYFEERRKLAAELDRCLSELVRSDPCVSH